MQSGLKRTVVAALLAVFLVGYSDAGETTLSNDAYVVRWQQSVMPITDVSVLGFLVSDEQLRELARDALDLSAEEMKDLSFQVQCYGTNGKAITEHGATIQVSVGIRWSPLYAGPQREGGKRFEENKHEFNDEQRAKFRRGVLSAWEENFSEAYRKASKSRQVDWTIRVNALKEKREIAEQRARQMRDEFSMAEQVLQTHETRSLTLAELDKKLGDYRMLRDENAARREALESQVKSLKSQSEATDDDEENGRGRKENGETKRAKIVEYFRRALELEERRLATLQRKVQTLRDNAMLTTEGALTDQVFEAENRAMQARIALERARMETTENDRMEAMLDQLHHVNLELMHITYAIRGIEQRKEKIVASSAADAPVANEAGVRQARLEYELAEHRLMRLNETLADLEDSGDNILTPLTFIRLSN